MYRWTLIFPNRWKAAARRFDPLCGAWCCCRGRLPGDLGVQRAAGHHLHPDCLPGSTEQESQVQLFGVFFVFVFLLITDDNWWNQILSSAWTNLMKTTKISKNNKIYCFMKRFHSLNTVFLPKLTFQLRTFQASVVVAVVGVCLNSNQ